MEMLTGTCGRWKICWHALWCRLYIGSIMRYCRIFWLSLTLRRAESSHSEFVQYRDPTLSNNGWCNSPVSRSRHRPCGVHDRARQAHPSPLLPQILHHHSPLYWSFWHPGHHLLHWPHLPNQSFHLFPPLPLSIGWHLFFHLQYRRCLLWVLPSQCL